MERRQLFGLMGLLLYALSGSAGAELKPLDDDALDRVTGQAGLSINVQTRIQASEIRYSQHNNDGSERGSISLKNFDLFGTGDGEDRIPREESLLDFLDRITDQSPEQRSFAELGLNEVALSGLAIFAAGFGVDVELIDGVGNLLTSDQIRNSTPDDLRGFTLVDSVTGRGIVTQTTTLDALSNSATGEGQLRLTLPQLSRAQREVFPLAVDIGEEGSAFLRPIIELAVEVIPLALTFDLDLSGNTVGNFLLKSFIGLDTELLISGRTGGESGLTVDGILGLGFAELRYTDTDVDGGSISLTGVRIGEADERNGDPGDVLTTGLLRRLVFGTPFNGLTFDVEQRSLLDLSTGVLRDASVLAIGLPDIQNLDITVDNIRIGEGNVGGLDILDINTLVDNATVQQLNQTFGYNFALGNGTGVDALGQAASGYQLSGELQLSGTADNSLQFNGQWGGQIGSINYYDNTGGTEGRVGLNEISVYGQGQNEQGDAILTPAQFSGTLTLNEQGIELGNLNAQGSIAIQSVTVGQTNLGAFLIDNFQLRDSHITISGK